MVASPEECSGARAADYGDRADVEDFTPSRVVGRKQPALQASNSGEVSQVKERAIALANTTNLISACRIHNRTGTSM